MAGWEPSERFDEWQGCIGCALYRRGRCDAYPDGIPLLIMSGEVDHMVPRPGQVGTTIFQPMDLERWRATGERRPKTAASVSAISTGAERR